MKKKYLLIVVLATLFNYSEIIAQCAQVAPYTEDFDAAAGSLPACWSQGSSNAEDWQFGDSSTTNHVGDNGDFLGTVSDSGGYYAYVDDSTPDNLGTTLESPMVDVSALTTPALSFYMISDNEGNSNVSFSVDFYDGSNWNTGIFTSSSNTSGWVKVYVDLSTYTITGDVQVRFIVDEDNTSGHYYDDVAIDDVSIDEFPSCVEPSYMTVSAIGSDSADLGWTENGSASLWNVEVVMAGSSATGVATSTGVSNPYTATGLLSNTDYEFYVQSDCGAGDLSSWVGPFAFTTNCAAQALPVCENFDSTSVGSSSNPTTPDCWSFIDSGTGYGYVRALNDRSAPNSFYMYNSSDSSGDYILVSPNISSLMSGNNWVDFWVDGSSGQDIVVGTMSDAQDATTFTALETITLATSSHENHQVLIPSGADSYLAFKHGQTGTYDAYYFDDICIEAQPSCFDPENFIAQNVSDTSLDLTWSEINTPAATTWDIEYGASGFVPTGVPSAGTTGVVSNPYTISSLTPNTDYDFYVRTDCGSGDTSDWVGPLAVTTACVSQSIPVCENFDTAPVGSTSNSTTPDCWNFIDSGSGYGYVTTSTDNSAPHSFRIYNSSDSTGDYILVSPGIASLMSGNNWVDFWVDGVSGQELIVGTMSDAQDAATFTALQTITLATSAYENYQILIPSGTDSYLAFKHGQTGTYDSYYLDDICIEAQPSCLAPSDAGVLFVTDTSANLSWSEVNTPAATTWDVEYGVAGFTPTGSPSTGLDNISSNPYLLTGLTASTSYEYYVRTDCGSGDTSTWVGPIPFNTDCSVTLAPYLEDFDTAAGSIPTCWNQGLANVKDWEFANSVGSDHIGNDGDFYGTTSASGNYFAFVDDSSPHETGTTLISAPVDVSALLEPTLSFYYVSDNEGNTNVDFSVDLFDGSTWQTGVFTSNTNTNGWVAVYIDLSAYTISGPVKARFVIDENNGTDFYDDVAIDDVSFDEAPPCMDPENIIVSNETQNSVEISWDDNNVIAVSQYYIEYGAPGFAQGSGTTLTVTSNPYTISGLTDDTEYEFYIQTECSANDLSSWVGPLSFETLVDCSLYTLDVTNTTDGSVCGGGSVTLGATATGNGTDIYWYDAATGGTYVGSGSILQTPSINSTTSYWAAEVVASGVTLNGMAKLTPNSGSTDFGGSGYGVKFDAYQSFTINTVEVYPDNEAGTFDIELIDESNEVVVNSASVTVPSMDGETPFVVNLNFNVTPGSYRLVQQGSIDMTRDSSGNTYPYAIGAVGDVTGGTYGSGSASSSYYYFYNWTVQTGEVQCESTRQEVVATVNNVADEEVLTLPFSQTETTSNYDNNYSGTSGCSSDIALDASDVIYHYLAAGDYIMTVEMSNLTESGSSVFVYESCADIGSACLAGEVNSGMLDYGFEFSATNGQDYYIVVSGEGDDYDYTIDINGETCANYSAPSGNATQDFLSGQKLADLNILGSDLTYYSDAAGTIEVSPYTLLNNGDVYYVSRSFDGCESALLMITATETSCTALNVVNTTGGEICDEGSALLYAEGSGIGSEIYWYTTPSGGSFIGYGSEFETPSVNQTTSYWASEVAYTKVLLEDLGAMDATYSPTTSSTNNYGLAFETQQDMEIVDVTVYSASATATDITVAVKDANSNEILMEKVLSLPGGGSSASPVTVVLPLGFKVEPGQYRLLKTSGPALVRDYYSSSVSNPYPYALGTSGAIVAGSYSTSSTSYYYNYFFDWTVVATEVVCESVRSEVQVTRKGLPGAPYGNTGQTVCTGSTLADLVVDGPEIYWYDAAEGGESLPLTTVLQDQTFYYASQVVDGCESEDRINVIVTVTDDGSAMPTGNAMQTFDTGDYITDLDVDGENLIWYADAAGTVEITDPQTTLLQDGVTYYVSQTIGAQCESDLLAITADEVLGVGNYKLDGLSLYPNPMKSQLNISYTSNIENIQVFDLLGKRVVDVNVGNASSKKLDVSHLSSGAYIVRVTVESGTGIYKLIKE